MFEHGRNLWYSLAQRWRWSQAMFGGNLGEGPHERWLSAEPFIDHHSKSILIRGWTWMRLDLFGCHVGDRAYRILGMIVARTLRHDSDAKVREQDLSLLTQQHVFRLDITVDQFAFMGIL